MQGGSTGDAKVVLRIAPPPVVEKKVAPPPPPPKTTSGNMQHGFNNTTKQQLYLDFSGAIIAVVAEAPYSGCRHGTGNTGCKHYLITMNDNYSSLEVSGISIYTAGGGTMGQNTIGKIEKVSGTTNQWRLWFKKGSNYYTTYVRGCTIKGIY